MTAGSHNSKQKQIYFRAYQKLSLLENALKRLKEKIPADFQISIIGNVIQFYRDKNIDISTDPEALKKYWEKTLSTVSFGSLQNPEIGNIFIVGSLASTFLYKIEGKTLGMLSAGPYGILRGIGANDIQVTAHLKMLKNDNYLLIISGNENEIDNYKTILEDEWSDYLTDSS